MGLIAYSGVSLRLERVNMLPEDVHLMLTIVCVHCHTIKNKIKNYATDKVKKL